MSQNILYTKISYSRTCTSCWRIFRISLPNSFLLDTLRNSLRLSLAVSTPTCVYDPHMLLPLLSPRPCSRIASLISFLSLSLSSRILFAADISAQILDDIDISTYCVLNFVRPFPSCILFAACQTTSIIQEYFILLNAKALPASPALPVVIPQYKAALLRRFAFMYASYTGWRGGQVCYII